LGDLNLAGGTMFAGAVCGAGLVLRGIEVNNSLLKLGGVLLFALFTGCALLFAGTKRFNAR